MVKENHKKSHKKYKFRTYSRSRSERLEELERISDLFSPRSTCFAHINGLPRQYILFNSLQS